MYITLIVASLLAGTAVSWLAASRRHAADLERAGGFILITGLALLGFALPIAQHVHLS